MSMFPDSRICQVCGGPMEVHGTFHCAKCGWEPMARPETGIMQFGDDWAGVFIRRDNAKFAAVWLRRLQIERANCGVDDPISEALLRDIINLLDSVDDDGAERTRLKTFDKCMEKRNAETV